MELESGRRRVLRAYIATLAIAEPLHRELSTRRGLSIADFRAVRVLARVGESPQGRLGDELGLPDSTVTNLVDRLERAALVERVPSPHDRRVRLVSLTPAGAGLADDVGFLTGSEIAGRLFALDPADQATLAELLERVAAVPSPIPATEVTA